MFKTVAHITDAFYGFNCVEIYVSLECFMRNFVAILTLAVIVFFFSFQEMMIFVLGVVYILTPRNHVSFCLLAVQLITFLFRRDLASVFHLISIENGLMSRSRRHLLNLCQMNASLRSLEGCLLAKIGASVLLYPSAGLCF